MRHPSGWDREYGKYQKKMQMDQVLGRLLHLEQQADELRRRVQETEEKRKNMDPLSNVYKQLSLQAQAMSTDLQTNDEEMASLMSRYQVTKAKLDSLKGPQSGASLKLDGAKGGDVSTGGYTSDGDRSEIERL